MGENGFQQFPFRKLSLPGNHIALDKFRHLSPDHVGAKQFARLRVEHRFHKTFRLAKRNGFSVSKERKPANFHIVTMGLRLGLR